MRNAMANSNQPGPRLDRRARPGSRMAMGICFGSLAGVAFGLPTGLGPWGISIGMVFGMLVGLLLDVRHRAKERPGGTG